MSIHADLKAVMEDDLDYVTSSTTDGYPAILSKIDATTLDPTITGTKGEQTNMDESEVAGFFANKNMEVVFKQSLFTARDVPISIPVIGSILVIDGSSYRVEDQLLSEDEVSVRFMLKAA